MKNKPLISSLVPGVLVAAVTSLLVGLGIVWSQGFPPGQASTGAPGLEIAASQRRFTFSADPSIAVVSVNWSGGLQGDSVTYVLYGDGRLVKTHIWAPGQSDSIERELNYGQARQLVRLAVEGDLMEWEWDQVRQRLIESTGNVPSWTDSRRLEVRIALESYSSPGPPNNEPVSKTVVIHSPGLLRLDAPHIRELVAIDELAKAVNLYFDLPEEEE